MKLFSVLSYAGFHGFLSCRAQLLAHGRRKLTVISPFAGGGLADLFTVGDLVGISSPYFLADEYGFRGR